VKPGRSPQTQGKGRKCGRRPIAEDQVALVHEDYARTGSHRKTAANTGLSRTSVQNIVNGRHLKVKSQSQLPRLLEGEVFSVVPVRCTNGHLVNIRPCRECLADVFAAVQRRDDLRQLEQQSMLRARGLSVIPTHAPPRIPVGPRFGFTLTPDQQARLDDVRAKRNASKPPAPPGDESPKEEIPMTTQPAVVSEKKAPPKPAAKKPAGTITGTVTRIKLSVEKSSGVTTVKLGPRTWKLDNDRLMALVAMLDAAARMETMSVAMEI